MNTEIQIKGWYNLKNGKIVYFDGSTTKTLGKNGKPRYIITATYFDSKITHAGLVQEYYNEVEILHQVDILNEMQKYNAILKSFGLEIVKIKSEFFTASEQVPEYDFDIIFYTNDGNPHHGYFDHEYNKFVSNSKNYAFPIEAVKNWKELIPLKEC